MAQPISPPPNGRVRSQRDWTARTRDTAMNALRYSRFVVVMKRVLPIAAGLLIAAVIAYSLMPRQSEKMSLATENWTIINNDLTMTKPRLTGTDRKGNPFVITADAAVQDPSDVRRATLKTVQADMTIDKTRWLNATAAKGYIDMDKGALALGGGIAVFSDDGYEIHTERVDIDLKKGLFHGPVAVNGQGPMGTFRADTFDVDRNSGEIQLHGHVHMTIQPPASRK
ncbi:MAG: LPS export ABC transporter periplasmic protein LptC [Rhizomicrobium sp.]